MIVLIGFMGAGKTTVGHLLAECLGLPFVDSDRVIEQRTGRAVREIFAGEGEPAFRRLEHVTVVDLLGGEQAVIALGGGAVDDPATRKALQGSTVVYLRVGLAEVKARVGGDELRPLLRTPGVEDLYRRRLPVYEEAATLPVTTDGRTAAGVVTEILSRLSAV